MALYLGTYFQLRTMIISDNVLQNGEFSLEYHDTYYSPLSVAMEDIQVGKRRTEIHSREECQPTCSHCVGKFTSITPDGSQP